MRAEYFSPFKSHAGVFSPMKEFISFLRFIYFILIENNSIPNLLRILCFINIISNLVKKFYSYV
jgi:hypothetical protein